MAKTERQKLKLLCLYDLFLQETDETNGLTVSEIKEKLSAQGIKAERKSIYNDIVTLEEYGCEILPVRDGHLCRYHLMQHSFELAELKLLVDAVQSSKFLPAKKSHDLIRKLSTLCSKYQAQALQRQVYVSGRVKSMNESIYYSIDTIHTAISADQQISFQYFTWTTEKTALYRHDGKRYCVSPFALIWDNENYYLVAFDASANALRHYRVDKMTSLSVESTKREGKASFADIDLGTYTKKMFGMFGGKEEAITLQFSAQLVGAVIDRFGKEAAIIPVNQDMFHLHTNVIVSPQFMGWLSSFGADAKILAPENTVQTYKAFCQKIIAQYE